MQYVETMKSAANQFKVQASLVGIETEGMSVSQNAAGVSIYFKGVDSFGQVFNFRFSDHDCQRGSGSYEKVSAQSAKSWVEDYEKTNFPERFNWEYLDKYITKPNGKQVQVKRFIGRK